MRYKKNRYGFIKNVVLWYISNIAWIVFYIIVSLVNFSKYVVGTYYTYRCIILKFIIYILYNIVKSYCWFIYCWFCLKLTLQIDRIYLIDYKNIQQNTIIIGVKFHHCTMHCLHLTSKTLHFVLHLLTYQLSSKLKNKNYYIPYSSFSFKLNNTLIFINRTRDFMYLHINCSYNRYDNILVQ